MIEFKMDGQVVSVEEGTTLLEAARARNIDIPTLCYHEELTPYGGCRLCLVETGGKLVPSCVTKAAEGMEVSTSSPRVLEARRFVVELLMARSPGVPELEEMAQRVGVPPAERLEQEDPVGAYLLRRSQRLDPTRCIRCGLCVRACAEIPRRFALSFAGRGRERRVTTPFEDVADTCIGCGSCAYVCPTNAITIEEADPG